MLGYILPNLSDLSAEEGSRYRAVYCGVCRSIRARYGQAPRLAVSYDMAFLALLLGSLYEPVERTGSKRCPVHPLEPQAFACSEFTDYAADLSIAFAYHKLRDDWLDDRSKRARAAAGALSLAYRRAKRRIPAQCAAIEAAMEDIHAIESAAQAQRAAGEGAGGLCVGAPDGFNPDAAANRFGVLLGELFAHRDDFWATDLRRFGARLGKFIYAMDAAVDLRQDRETGSYNPFVFTGVSFLETREGLELLAAAAVDLFERLPLERDANVLRSVLYAGVWQRYHEEESKDHHG